jgi:putative DNA methylase
LSKGENSRGVEAASRKLIEVAIPLEAINRAAAADGPKRKFHPWRLHYWWARRKLVVGRAVLFAQLVDDPSSNPEKFPTEEDQRVERERLHALIERLVVWESTRDKKLLEEAHEEILNSTGGNPPPIFDPFAGGGTIPLEAQRLGLEAHASDLNPVAVLINKALIEIPPKFAGRPPVFPGREESKLGDWRGASGLADDVRAYGEWIRDEASERIGDHYPKAELEDGSEAAVIAWIWARTVTCPNPACGIELPLVRSWWLGMKKGKEAWVRPVIVSDASHPSGQRVEFTISHDPSGPQLDGTMSGRAGATCVACHSAVPKGHVKAEGLAGRLGATLMAVVAAGNRRRAYVAPTTEHREAAAVAMPGDVPDQEIGDDPRNLWTPSYGLKAFADLFTRRQLLALTTFSDLVIEARERVLNDALESGMPTGDRLEAGGDGAEAYADAVAIYLGLGVSRSTDYMSSITSWHARNEQIRTVFARQAIPMTWDFTEINPLGTGSGTLFSQVELAAEVLDGLDTVVPATAVQGPAQTEIARSGGWLLSTDPPYYDNVGYSDLSDFFYVWLRRTLREVQPALLGTVLVPKSEELVANPYRQDGKTGAKNFFENGFRSVFADARKTALDGYPITVYYAFKQAESGEFGSASSGWETLLDGMIGSGWLVTATWPFRTETATRMVAHGKNTLASSIVLSLRPRPEDSPTTDRRGFIADLQAKLPAALRELQQGAIAPVDLPQAAIGPGMAVFSTYKRVIEDDGSSMTVRAALAQINEILDQVLSEQEGDFSSHTRFAITWYKQHGYATGSFGDANNIAQARNTSVDALDRAGVVESAAGKAKLISPEELAEDYDVLTDDSVSEWEVLHHLIAHLDRGGLAAAGKFISEVRAREEGTINLDLVKELAYMLFADAEANGFTQDAIAFNTVATSWPEILDASRSEVVAGTGTQTSLEL